MSELEMCQMDGVRLRYPQDVMEEEGNSNRKSEG